MKAEEIKEWIDKIKVALDDEKVQAEDLSDVRQLLKEFEDELVFYSKDSRKITPEIVERWKKLRTEGWSYNRIAEKFNVERLTVSYWFNEKQRARMKANFSKWYGRKHPEKEIEVKTEGMEGQDRDNYTDTQDRDSYKTEEKKE